MIFDIVFDPFSSICSFFLVNLLAPYIVIFHLITLKRLLLQNTDLIYLSWFTFYNFFCTKSLKIAKKFLTIMYTVKKRKLLSFITQKWFKISKKCKQIWIQHSHSYYLPKNFSKKISKWKHCNFLSQHFKAKQKKWNSCLTIKMLLWNFC